MNYRVHIFFLLISLVYFIALIYTLNNPQLAQTGDAEEYIQAAENLVRHGTIYCGNLSDSPNPDLFSRRPPLYPIVLSFFMLIFDNAELVLMLQVLLTFLNGYIIFKITALYELAFKWRIAIVGCFLLYPSQIIFTNLIMTEILLQSLLLISFFYFIKFTQTGRIWFLFLYNSGLAAAVLTKPLLLYFGIPNLFLHLWLYFRYRQKRILLFPFIIVIVIGAWSYRNYQRTGYYHFSSIKYHNLLRYNVRGLLTRIHNSDKAEQQIVSLTETADEQMSYKERIQLLENDAMKVIRENLFEYSLFHLNGVLNFFIDPGRFDIYSFLGMQSKTSLLKLFNKHGVSGVFIALKEIPLTILVYLVLMTLLNFLLLITFIYFIFHGGLQTEYKVLLIILVLYIAFVTGPIGASRFRLPIYPFLIFTLPLFIQNIGDNLQKWAWQRWHK